MQGRAWGLLFIGVEVGSVAAVDRIAGELPFCSWWRVEDIDLGVTRQEGRVTLRVIARSPELSFKIMG